MKKTDNRKLYIYGAGGLAREVTTLIESINRSAAKWEVQGYITDDPKEHGKRIHHLTVLGAPEEIFQSRSLESCDVVMALGTPKFLRAKSGLLRRLHPAIRFPSLIHPGVEINATMGEGNIIAAASLFTVDVRLGNFNVINMRTILAHDVSLGDYCVVNPGAILNGDVKIANRAVIGAGAVILRGVTVGEGAVVAIGAVVGADVEPFTVVAGNPARPVRRLEPE